MWFYDSPLIHNTVSLLSLELYFSQAYSLTVNSMPFYYCHLDSNFSKSYHLFPSTPILILFHAFSGLVSHLFSGHFFLPR